MRFLRKKQLILIELRNIKKKKAKEFSLKNKELKTNNKEHKKRKPRA